MYGLLRPLMFKLDAEDAHNRTLDALKLAGKLPPVRGALQALYRVTDPRLAVGAFGLEFANPVGLAAGYDKNGGAARGLAALGFGQVREGLVTGAEFTAIVAMVLATTLITPPVLRALFPAPLPQVTLRRNSITMPPMKLQSHSSFAEFNPPNRQRPAALASFPSFSLTNGPVSTAVMRVAKPMRKRKVTSTMTACTAIIQVGSVT